MGGAQKTRAILCVAKISAAVTPPSLYIYYNVNVSLANYKVQRKPFEKQHLLFL